MTPLRSSLTAISVGVALAAAVTAASPADGARAAAQECEVAGWTAYAPLDEPTGRDVYSYIGLCAGDGPPQGWPPGAQPAADQPEIHVIR